MRAVLSRHAAVPRQPPHRVRAVGHVPCKQRRGRILELAQQFRRGFIDGCFCRIIGRLSHPEVHQDGVSRGALHEENAHAPGVEEHEGARHIGDKPGFPLTVAALRDGCVSG